MPSTTPSRPIPTERRKAAQQMRYMSCRDGMMILEESCHSLATPFLRVAHILVDYRYTEADEGLARTGGGGQGNGRYIQGDAVSHDRRELSRRSRPLARRRLPGTLPRRARAAAR